MGNQRPLRVDFDAPASPVAGTVQLRSVLDELLDDEPFPESDLELAPMRVLAGMGLEGFRRQYRPPWFDGVRGVATSPTRALDW